MRDILKFSYQELISKLKKIDYIESLTLIGKSPEKRKLDKIVDIDLVLIISQPMTIKKYREIKKIFLYICEKYSTKQVAVLYAIADGPMKPNSNKEKEIFFHCVLHTPESYKKMPLKLCKNSWQSFSPIKGKPLKFYQKFKGVNKKMVLEGALGINHLIEFTNTDSSGYIGWKKGPKKEMEWNLLPIQFKHYSEKADLYIYSILRSASNALRFIKKNNQIGIDTQMAKMFKEEFPKLKYKNLPKNIIKDKTLLRNKKYKKNILKLKNQTLNFLIELKEDIEKNY